MQRSSTLSDFISSTQLSDHCSSWVIIPSWAWSIFAKVWNSITFLWSFISLSLNFWCLCSRMIAWRILTVRFDSNSSISPRAWVCCHLEYYRKDHLLSITYILSKSFFALRSSGSYSLSYQPYTNQVREDPVHEADNYVLKGHGSQLCQMLLYQRQTLKYAYFLLPDFPLMRDHLLV